MNEMTHLEKQKTESGQATVEYILLIAIGVVLILGLASVVYKPFGEWTKTYMTTYLECLLDVGELPSLGASGDTPVCTMAPFKRGQANPGLNAGANGEKIKGSPDSGGPGKNKNSSRNSNENGTANGRSGNVQGGLMGAESAAAKRKNAGGLDEAGAKDVSSDGAGGPTRYYRAGPHSFSMGGAAGADGAQNKPALK